MDDFDLFWSAYPRKVAKGAARKAFEKAIKLTAIEDMLAALDEYKRLKPNWQPFCHPRTWLAQERWDDEYEAEQPTSIQGIALMEAGYGRDFSAGSGTVFTGTGSESGGSNIISLSAKKRQL